MSSLQSLNEGAERTGPQHSLAINVAAGQGLAEVLKSNLGPRGSTKMLVGGAGTAKQITAEIAPLPLRHISVLLSVVTSQGFWCGCVLYHECNVCVL